MFELELAIGNWRRQMKAGGVPPDALDELEDHLRGDVSARIAAGVSVREAFQLAVDRMGDPETVKQEFAKIGMDEARQRILQIRCYILSAACYPLPLALSGARAWSGMSGSELIFGLTAIAFTVLSMFNGLFTYRILPVISNTRLRTIIQIAMVIPVVAWLYVYSYVLLPRIELNLGQVKLATVWAIFPLGVIAGLVFGLDEATRQKARRAPMVYE